MTRDGNSSGRKRPMRPTVYRSPAPGTVCDLLDRLEKVRLSGPDRWIACCPSHADRTPSLSVRRGDDRWLIHCFAGCSAVDVVRSIGLELADLFDDRVFRHTVDRQRGPRISAAEKLELIEHELMVAAFILSGFIENKGITEPDWQRLATATARIGAARHV